jgi:hypothetical protein
MIRIERRERWGRASAGGIIRVMTMTNKDGDNGSSGCDAAVEGNYLPTQQSSKEEMCGFCGSSSSNIIKTKDTFAFDAVRDGDWWYNFQCWPKGEQLFALLREDQRVTMSEYYLCSAIAGDKSIG